MSSINEISMLENRECDTNVSLLDIAGFGNIFKFKQLYVSKIHVTYFVECFDQSMNLFEQFCINYANEKIQSFITHRLIYEECEWYKAEGLDIPEISFPGNDEILSEYIYCLAYKRNSYLECLMK